VAKNKRKSIILPLSIGNVKQNEKYDWDMQIYHVGKSQNMISTPHPWLSP